MTHASASPELIANHAIAWPTRPRQKRRITYPDQPDILSFLPQILISFFFFLLSFFSSPPLLFYPFNLMHLFVLFSSQFHLSLIPFGFFFNSFSCIFMLVLEFYLDSMLFYLSMWLFWGEIWQLTFTYGSYIHLDYIIFIPILTCTPSVCEKAFMAF